LDYVLVVPPPVPRRSIQGRLGTAATRTWFRWAGLYVCRST